jgi:outer membrane protein assembly factor BamB
MSYPVNARVLIAGLIVVIVAVHSRGNDESWSQFRGPGGNAVSDASNTAVSVSQSNTRWKTTIPGTGWSSPVVSGGRIWLTTAETTAATPAQIAAKTKGVQFAKIKTVAASVTLRAVCVDAESGKLVHNVILRQVDDPDLINPLNSYASPTPAISGNRVICHFGSYGTWCLDASTGETIWQKALVVDHSVGPGSSPVIVDDVVVLVCDGIDRQFVAGLSLQSGEKVWETDRPPMRTSNPEFKKAYSTPLVITAGKQLQAVVPGAQWVCAYAPATGTEIWRADIGDGFSTTPMAIYESGVLVCSTGYMAAKLVGFAPRGQGDITKEIIWKSEKGGSKMPTAVAKDGLLYSISDAGILSILEIQTGDVKERIRVGGKFASSPLLVGDKLYLGSQEGDFSVFQIARDSTKPKKLATSRLDGSIMASPAVVGTDLVVRTSESLWRITPES